MAETLEREATSLHCPQRRSFGARIAHVNVSERTVELSFSSEQPVERFFRGEMIEEVLDHQAADLSRINTQAEFLRNHDINQKLGGVVRAWIEGNRGRAIVKLSRSQAGEDALRDYEDGIGGQISVGYDLTSVTNRVEREGVAPVVRFAWQPHEISAVTVGADSTVGVGRSPDKSKQETKREMSEDTTTPTVTRSAASVVSEPPPDLEKIRKEAEEAGRRDLQKTWSAVEEFVGNNPAAADLGERVKRGEIDLMTFYTEAGRIKPEDRNAAAPPDVSSEPLRFNQGNLLDTVPAQEFKRYSLLRAIDGLRRGKIDGFEGEMHEECSRNGGFATKGVIIPWQGFYSRQQQLDAMNMQRAWTDTSGQGIEGVATAIGDVIELLRSRVIVASLGARVLSGLTSNVQLPTHATAQTVNWDAETDTNTEGGGTMGSVSITPKRVGAIADISFQLLIQSTPDIEQLVRDDIMDSIAVTVDTAAIEGSGAANQPEGIITAVDNASGAAQNRITFGGAATWADLVQMWSQVATDDAAMGSLAYLTTPAAAEQWLQIEKATNTGLFLASGTPGAGMTVLGFPLATRTAITTNKAVFGNFNDVILATFGPGIDLIEDNVTQAPAGSIRLVATLFTDVAVRHTESFSVSTDSAAQ